MAKKGETDIFKVLSHETRRRLLLYIGENEEASFTQLSEIESKPGKLYYHLRLMSKLVTQNEDGLYILTDLGKKAYELLMSGEISVELERPRKVFPMRRMFDAFLNKLSTDATLILAILLSIGLIYISLSYNMVIIPFYVLSMDNGPFLTLGFLILSTAVFYIYSKSLANFNLDRFIKGYFSLTLALLLNLSGFMLGIYFSTNLLQPLVVLCFQLLSLLIFSSGIESAFNISLRRSIIVPLIIHYASSVYVFLYLS